MPEVEFYLCRGDRFSPPLVRSSAPCPLRIWRYPHPRPVKVRRLPPLASFPFPVRKRIPWPVLSPWQITAQTVVYTQEPARSIRNDLTPLTIYPGASSLLCSRNAPSIFHPSFMPHLCLIYASFDHISSIPFSRPDHLEKVLKHQSFQVPGGSLS